jgi:hypothetical protein
MVWSVGFTQTPVIRVSSLPSTVREDGSNAISESEILWCISCIHWDDHMSSFTLLYINPVVNVMFYEGKLDQVGRLCCTNLWDSLFYHLYVLSTKRGVLKFLLIMDLSSLPFLSVNFCYIQFEAHIRNISSSCLLNELVLLSLQIFFIYLIFLLLKSILTYININTITFLFVFILHAFSIILPLIIHIFVSYREDMIGIFETESCYVAQAGLELPSMLGL